MKLSITHQEHYSRGELLLRSFFGWLYIGLPHMFLLLFVGIWSGILGFVAFFIILFTGRYPQSMYEFQVGYLKWNLRVSARIYNLADGYPAFGVNAQDDYTSLEIEYPEKISRGLTVLRLFFGVIYVYLPHGFLLFFRAIAVAILMFIAWWAVLFTAKFPKSMHDFIVGQLRWSTRVNLYMSNMTDDYPPFTGDE
jgi:hypothetical protein